jgi:hypothetical protein
LEITANEGEHVMKSRQSLPLWIAQLRLKPLDRVFSACCMEPDEGLSLTLKASRLVDIALVDWEAYARWEKSGGSAIPGMSDLATRGRRIRWTARSTAPPYIKMLMLWNPGDCDADVEIVAVARPPAP